MLPMVVSKFAMEQLTQKSSMKNLNKCFINLFFYFSSASEIREYKLDSKIKNVIY